MQTRIVSLSLALLPLIVSSLLGYLANISGEEGIGYWVLSMVLTPLWVVMHAVSIWLAFKKNTATWLKRTTQSISIGVPTLLLLIHNVPYSLYLW